MADITLTLDGDASGAQAALSGTADATSELANETGKAAVKWQELANIAKAAASAVVKFGVDAVKAFADAERVQRQLNRAAGEYGETLGDLADALEKQLNVDGDLVKQSQTLLAQWGGLGAASEKTTRAILDYAAATGQDAVAATNDLIRNVETGGKGLAKLGVHFEATGHKGEDLKRAVDALGKKFGGAAAADGASLHGQLVGVGNALDDFTEGVGGAIAEILRASNTVPTLTKAIRELNESLFTPTAKKQAESQEYIAQQVQYWEDIAAGNVVGYKDFATKTQFTFEEAQARLAEWRAKLRPGDFNVTPSIAPAVTGLTSAGLAEAAANNTKAKKVREDNSKDFREYLKGIDDLDLHAEEQQKKHLEEMSKATWEAADAEEKDRNERLRKEHDFLAEVARKQDDERLQREKQAEDKALKDAEERTKKRTEQFRQAGDQIGAAFVNALTDQLSKLAEGGEFDAALFVGDILASVVSVAATAIGSAYGMPALGAAVGNLASMGIRAGAGAISADGRKARTRPQYHSGGWVGADGMPRYHDGSWIGSDEQMAVLQTGERVLSRSEVHHMGGAAGVERAVRGGPSVVVNIKAIDSKSAAESFEADLGRGMRRALRAGRGDLPSLIGGYR